MKKIILLLIFIPYICNADLWEILDNKIERFCRQHELANEQVYDNKWWKLSSWRRCTVIWQAQIRMETTQCTKWLALTKKNCFWLKWKNNRFITFKDYTWSIKAWVNRYYRLDRYKNIFTIVFWYKKNGNRWYWYTATDKQVYYNFVRKYFLNNIKWIK